jgi:hypothetical protein
MGRRHATFPARRRFLKQTVAAGGSGVLMILAARDDADGDSEHSTAEPAGPVPESRGYRLTDHIRAYYDTARS